MSETLVEVVARLVIGWLVETGRLPLRGGETRGRLTQDFMQFYHEGRKEEKTE